MLTLRPYQQAAVDAVYRHLQTDETHPCVVIPTAGGKTPLIASICKDVVTRWNGRVLILSHVKELLEQAADKLRAVCPELHFGINSAGLKRKDKDQAIIIAGIQSVYRKACDLGPFDLILVDECHLIAPDGEGMYRQFLREAQIVNPQVRVIGFTATPFRLKSGSIVGPDQLFQTSCYEVGVRDLIDQGYLCPLISQAGQARVDLSHVHVRGGEFAADELAQAMDQIDLVAAACREIVRLTADRQAVLIFCTSIAHAQHVAQLITEFSCQECGFVSGETPSQERERTLARFRQTGQQQLFADPPLKYLANVNVLTTGFDAPQIDCVVLLRPTMSPGLYQQMVGRGFRLHPQKSDCLVLDFGGNIERHGPIDLLEPVAKRTAGSQVAPAKECPKCHRFVATALRFCTACGYGFPEPERKQHAVQASQEQILSQVEPPQQFIVQQTYYSIHQKKGSSDDAPRSMRVDYQISLNEYKSEWICFEHEGYARSKAETWWRNRSHEPVPNTTANAVALADAGFLAETRSITVRRNPGDKFERIVKHELAAILEPIAVATTELDDVPF